MSNTCSMTRGRRPGCGRGDAGGAHRGIGAREVRGGGRAGQGDRGVGRGAAGDGSGRRSAGGEAGPRGRQRDRLGAAGFADPWRPPPRLREGAGPRDAAHPGGPGGRSALGMARHADRPGICLPRRRPSAHLGRGVVRRRRGLDGLGDARVAAAAKAIAYRLDPQAVVDRAVQRRDRTDGDHPPGARRHDVCDRAVADGQGRVGIRRAQAGGGRLRRRRGAEAR